MELQTSGRPIEVLMEKVLSMNIVSSDYFKELYKIKTYHEVIDEIYNQVDHVEPWMTGNCRGPSTAFCLLYKLFTMKLTVNQMHGLLKHPDSPYIRAIGFLYLRYAADPKTLWTWYEPYIQDDEEFSPGSNGKMTTMGVYVRDVILGQYYFDSLLPRVPLLILRQVTAHLEKMKLPTKQSGITGDSSRLGSDDTARRPPSVKASLSVSFGQRAPHRASTRDSSPVRKTLPSVRERERSHDGGHAKSPPRKHRSQSRERSRDTERDRSDRDRGRYKDREHGRQSRDNRDRDYRRSSYSDRDVERRGHERRDRDSDRNGRSSGRRSRSRSRSRSPSRGRTNGDSHRSSPFGKAPESSNLAKLKDLYGDATNAKDDAGDDRAPRRDSGTEEVIRLGGARWR
ncbi:pre-mRNA splicing factor SR-like 1 isoform X1 [Hordeum vulgare subsp. vulgare]|uniref:Pre-mRNA-splicing factor 38 n=1 Tax=Hordeum vulgare subsp. vulgare TaxID=112509 RepID=A0A8I6YH73_HORVV|nr:pre-mRNA splicing factor SR-like 1 isoform X1 [Hordeum vulgare subsp. vulgare]XP_044955989.1 pre-mRNA splicing factor SR-like 1 isoform X1 [Hordeum vulgare subsp. vulgare]